ncbi:PASTA domain-containing protein [Nocardia takedensis]
MITSGLRQLRVLARVMPTWKLLCAIGFFGFAVFCAVVLPFSGLGFPAVITYVGLALLPVLYLIAADRKYKRATGQPRLSFNPVPLGIVVSIALIFGGALAADALEPGRDPDTVMPDLVGMELPAAKNLLRDLDLDIVTRDDTGEDRQVWIEGNWTVTSQTPAAGTLLAELAEAELGVVKTGETPRPATPIADPPTTSSAQIATPTPTPPRNACLLIDTDALTTAHLSPTLEQPLTDPATPINKATYACGNDLSEVAIEITTHAGEADAAAAADYATRPDILTDPYTPFAHATRVPLPTGAKVIATETGVSRISWSHGLYSILLEINSDPVVTGLTSRHPHTTIDRLADAIIDRTEQALANDSW